MRWKPFKGGVPYTCQECPALREANEEIESLRKDMGVQARAFKRHYETIAQLNAEIKTLRVNIDTLKTVIQFMENGDEVYRLD